MERNGNRRLPGFVAALAAATLLLTTGASGSAASIPEPPQPVKRTAELTLMTRTDNTITIDLHKAVPESKEEDDTIPSPMPQTEVVEDTYFDNAVFLGDSRTEGLQLYSGLKTGHFYTSVGATVQSVFKKAVWETEDGEKIPLLDAMKTQDCDKIYIMLGVNELGWSKTQNYRDQYAALIDRVREDHPDAKIVLQSLPPVSAKQDAKKTYVNNKRIAAYNEIIKALAEEKECYFLDVAACLTAEGGVLPVKQTTDGVHFNASGCKTWLGYLRNHSLEPDAVKAALKTAGKS